MNSKSVLYDFDYDLAASALGCNARVRLDQIFHFPHRVDQDADFALLDESGHDRGSVLGWRRAEHDVPAGHTAEPRWPPGVGEPVPERCRDAFEGADVDHRAQRLEVGGRVGIERLDAGAVENGVELLSGVCGL